MLQCNIFLFDTKSNLLLFTVDCGPRYACKGFNDGKIRKGYERK